MRTDSKEDYNEIMMFFRKSDFNKDGVLTRDEIYLSVAKVFFMVEDEEEEERLIGMEGMKI